MEYATLAVERQGAVAHVWLNRPERRNALSGQLLEDLTAAFVAHGAAPDLPAAIVDNGTRPNQRVIVGTLADLAAKARTAGLRGPTIVIVGTVVSLRKKLDWRRRPDGATEANEEQS